MRYITLAIAFLIGTNALAQIIRAEPFYTAPEAAVSGNLLLDDYPGAAVAYSLRKLDKDYTGSAIRVRRSNDNAEQNIGFVNNYLDTASMKTFVGANNGFVVTWYNQADSSGVFGVRNVTQGTAANQPRIVNAGSIERENGEVSIYFDGSNDVLLSQLGTTFNFLHNGTSSAIISVNKYGNSTPGPDGTIAFLGTLYNASNNSVGSVRLLYDNRSVVPVTNATFTIIDGSAFAGVGLNRQSNTLNPNVITLRFTRLDADNATASNRIIDNINNGSDIATNTATGAAVTTPITQYLIIGATGTTDSGSTFNWGINETQEIIIYNSDQSANRTAIRDNINSFYSIY